MKTPTIHPKYGPRLMLVQRHEYTPLTEEQKDERDPNDPVKISFEVAEPEMVEWIDKRLRILKEYDSSFYVHQFQTGMGTLYQISTKHSNLAHSEYEKFMFQVKLKLGKDVKIR